MNDRELPIGITGRRVIAGFLVLVWLVALTQPVATTRHLAGNQTFSGVGILFLGTIGPLELMCSWYANPLFMLGLLLSIRPFLRSSGMLLTIAVAIALLVLNAALWSRIPDDSGANPIIKYHAGYWLWMTAMALSAGWFGLLASWLRRDQDVARETDRRMVR